MVSCCSFASQLLLLNLIEWSLSSRVNARRVVHLNPKGTDTASTAETKDLWSDFNLQHISASLKATGEALDLFGWSGKGDSVRYAATMLVLLETPKSLLGLGSDDGDEDYASAWVDSLEEHTEYIDSLRALHDASSEAMEEDLQEQPIHGEVLPRHHSKAQEAGLAEVLTKQLLKLSKSEVEEKLSILKDTFQNLQTLREKCTSHNGDFLEDAYARLWRLSEALLSSSQEATSKKFYRALRTSAYEALIQKQAQDAEDTIARVACPAAASAAHNLVGRLGSEDKGDEDELQGKISFLLGFLNDPKLPSACRHIYDSILLGTKGATTCACNPGQCMTKVIDQSKHWTCAACGTNSCHQFWQKEACELGNGCDVDVPPVPVVLGSEELTQTLLRYDLYLDPRCKGVVECLENTITKRLDRDRASNLRNAALTLWRGHRDWVAVAAIAAMASTLIAKYKSGALLELNGTQPLLLEMNASLAASNGPSWLDYLTPENINSLVGKIKPVHLAFLWLHFRIKSVQERASHNGFCWKAAREISGLQALQEAKAAKLTGPKEQGASELSEIFASAASSDGSESDVERKAEMLLPLMKDVEHQSHASLVQPARYNGLIGAFARKQSPLLQPHLGLFSHPYFNPYLLPPSLVTPRHGAFQPGDSNADLESKVPSEDSSDLDVAVVSPIEEPD